MALLARYTKICTNENFLLYGNSHAQFYGSRNQTLWIYLLVTPHACARGKVMNTHTQNKTQNKMPDLEIWAPERIVSQPGCEGQLLTIDTIDEYNPCPHQSLTFAFLLAASSAVLHNYYSIPASKGSTLHWHIIGADW